IVRLSAADISTLMQYTSLAAGPIGHYVSQFGPNQVSVNPVLLSAVVDVPTTQYDNGWVEGWVKTIAQDASIPSTDCICILNVPPMVNTDAAVADGVGGFHQFSSCPYVFVNVLAMPLTVNDVALRYAHTLSHEIAEMIVDPLANVSNPEVCDPCAGNCD